MIGKVKRVKRESGSAKPDLEFTYDPMGNRVMKKVINSSGTTTTYYLRDAQGNVLTTYKEDDNNDIYLQDFAIYGSSRLGILNINKKVLDLPNLIDNTNPVQTEIGKKYYELSNHLGNVLSTISDRKIEHGSGTLVDYYTADIISATDYYPFGFAMDNRNFSSSDYRFGFNGMEKDDEMKGSGNSYTTEFRQYDSRLGRWLSLDPRIDFQRSPYSSMGDNPIFNNDILGDEFKTKKDKRLANKVQKNADSQISYYEKQISSNNLSNEEVAELREMIIELENAKLEIDDLSNSETVYTFNKRGVNVGGNLELADNGIVTMNYDNFNTMVHELKHAHQFEKGDISFNMNLEASTSFYDINDEVEAYKRGFAFGDKGHFNGYNKITKEAVRNLEHPVSGEKSYFDLPDEKRSYNNIRKITYQLNGDPLNIRKKEVRLIDDMIPEYFSKSVSKQSSNTLLYKE